MALGKDHWNEVCRSVDGVSARWETLAKNLGLDANCIGVIARDKHSVNECLSEALNYWLQCNYNERKYGYPSWRTLAKAVKPLDGSLFNDIKIAHPSKLDIL